MRRPAAFAIFEGGKVAKQCVRAAGLRAEDGDDEMWATGAPVVLVSHISLEHGSGAARMMVLLPYLIVTLASIGLIFRWTGIGGSLERPAGASAADWLLRLARWLYGGYFLFVAAMIARMLLTGGPGIHQPTAAAKAFMDAMNATGFFNPLLMIDYALGGGALLFRRTAPLGLALLAPTVGVIFLFHLMLTGNIIWGGGWALGWVLLAWPCRSAFAALWNFVPAPRSP
jgi:hypothetical protein